MPKRKTRKRRQKPKKSKRRVSLKGRARGQLVECVFQCPAKGRVEVRAWARKGETRRQTCQRALKTRVRIDKPQIPLCKQLRSKDLD